MKEPTICDGCGSIILPGQVRYVLRIEVFADYEDIPVTEEDLKRDGGPEMSACLKELNHMDADSLHDQVYRNFDYILCRPCQVRYITNPIHPLTGDFDRSRVH